MGAGTSAEEFFLKSINVESIFEFVERTDYLFLYSINTTLQLFHKKNIVQDFLMYNEFDPKHYKGK